MKRLTFLLTAIILTTGIGFGQDKKKKEKTKETLEFRLNEHICANCKRKIDNYIAFEKGVTALKYGEDGSTVKVTFRTDKTDSLKLRNAFEKVKLEVVDATWVTKEEKK